MGKRTKCKARLKTFKNCASFTTDLHNHVPQHITYSGMNPKMFYVSYRNQ